MARNLQRPIGFGFILLVPYLSLWAYDWLKRWLQAKREEEIYQELLVQPEAESTNTVGDNPAVAAAAAAALTTSAVEIKPVDQNLLLEAQETEVQSTAFDTVDQPVLEAPAEAAYMPTQSQTPLIDTFVNQTDETPATSPEVFLDPLVKADSTADAQTKTPETQPLRPFPEVLKNIQGGDIDEQDCLYLVKMLRSEQTQEVMDGLTLVNKLSVSGNVAKGKLYRYGIHPELRRLMRSYSKTDCAERPLVIRAINNLVLDENQDVQGDFHETIEPLMDVVMTSDESATQLAGLQALTNISLFNVSHDHFTKLIQHIYELLDQAKDQNVKLQLCILLNNLSKNMELVPHLLAAKAPVITQDLVKGSEEIAKRWLWFLNDICHTALEQNIHQSHLPSFFKAPSPETMYAQITGSNSDQFCSVLLSRKYDDPELTTLAAKLHKTLSNIDSRDCL